MNANWFAPIFFVVVGLSALGISLHYFFFRVPISGEIPADGQAFIAGIVGLMSFFMAGISIREILRPRD